MSMTTTNLPPDVPWPSDKTFAPRSEWDEDGERHFWGTDRDGVQIHGFQKADGSIRARWICVDHELGEMSADEARSKGLRLIAAADELASLTDQQQ